MAGPRTLGHRCLMSEEKMTDVPSPIDLRLISDAQEWERTALSKRPCRSEFFARFASEISRLSSVQRVLELGSGPGFLAEHLLRAASNVKELVLLDFSLAMHQLAKDRLGPLAERVMFVERSFREPNWVEGLGKFDCVVTHQAVHELRHKRYAVELHAQVHKILLPGGFYLVCDHFFGEGGMKNNQLYMSIEEQRVALQTAGFSQVTSLMQNGGLVLHRAS